LSIVTFCAFPRSGREIQDMLGIKDRMYFRNAILQGLLDSGALVMTIPDKPKSRFQKYVAKDTHA